MVSGWVVAVLALVDITNIVPRFLNGAFIEFPIVPSEIPTTVAFAALLPGFLQYGGRARRRQVGLGLRRTEQHDDHPFEDGFEGRQDDSRITPTISPKSSVIAPSVGLGLTKTAFISGLILFVVNLVGVS